MRGDIVPSQTYFGRVRDFMARMRDPVARKDIARSSFRLFVAYHIVKGTITTVFIWLPLAYLWLRGG